MPNSANLSKKTAEHVLYAKPLGFSVRKCPFSVTQTSKSCGFEKGNGPLELVIRKRPQKILRVFVEGKPKTEKIGALELRLFLY